MAELKTSDIRNIFIEKYQNQDFRVIGNNVQQSTTVEIQNAHFIADKDWIIREPNEDYVQREIEWYMSQSLNVNDIPGGAPSMWVACADPDGRINSNYGWAIFSKENDRQYENCKRKLIEDMHTREAIMIYNRPSMQRDYNRNGMHDFMCMQNVQYFINDGDIGGLFLDCIVNIRSNDAVFGYDNDYRWVKYVQEMLCNDITEELNEPLYPGVIYWNAGSLHVYERHFKFLEQENNNEENS